MKLLDIPSYLDNEVINYIDEVCEANSDCDFDEKKFIDWLNRNNVRGKTNPSAYIKACFKRELLKGVFEKETIEYIPNTQAYLNELREKGIVIKPDESTYISVLFNYLLNEINIDIEILKQLNRSVLNYMKKGQTFSDYKKNIQNSNTLKNYQIDWEEIENRTAEINNEWEELLEHWDSMNILESEDDL